MHDLTLSTMFAQRIALLSQGRIIGQDAPEAILADANLHAAHGCARRVNTVPAARRWILPQTARAS